MKKVWKLCDRFDNWYFSLPYNRKMLVFIVMITLIISGMIIPVVFSTELLWVKLYVGFVIVEAIFIQMCGVNRNNK